MNQLRCLQALCLFLCTVSYGLAEDWPQWGRTPARNMVAPGAKIPLNFEPGKFKPGTEIVDMATTKHIKWVAKLGSQAYGNAVVSNGKVYVGTNNESPRDPNRKGDYGVIMCFNEADGALLWQLLVPKLGSGKVNDWEYLGICSSPAVEDNRVYLISNRCEVICLDTEGLANGNDGPFKNEGAYMAGAGKKPLKLNDKDADIVWIYDMREELGVFPHNIASSSVLVVDDKVYATTSNGQDWSHVNIPSPNAPTLVVLDRKTGKLLGEEASNISRRLFHCNWSSPAFGKVAGRSQVVFGAGDGFVYGFHPEPEKDAEGFGILKELWRYDANPEKYKTRNGKKVRYPSPNGPSEIIATPVLYKDRIYVATGQDPEHGSGVGHLVCIDPKKAKGDITKSGALWTYEKIERSISTVAIANGLVFAADFTGFLHCLDAETGKVYWVHDTVSNIWSSPLVVDGKVFIGNEDGVLLALAASKEEKVLKKFEFNAPIYSSPIVANGVLYIGTQTHLYAVAP